LLKAFAVAVVHLALLRLAQHVVGSLNLLEPLLGLLLFLFIFMQVRMVFPSQTAIRLLNFLRGSVARDLECLVVIFGH